MFNKISISVSDDDSDELAGKMRVRVRRKRKKLGFRGRNNCCRRMFRNLIKWWPVLIFLPAIGLLVFEASRLATKSTDTTIPNVKKDASHVVRENDTILNVKNDDVHVIVEENKPQGNLNRLSPTTKMINGRRQACLKLLPPDALEHLDVPSGGESDSPVRRVIYKSDGDTSDSGGDSTLFQKGAEAGRFNLFTGSQTLYEREKSFQVNETAVVHCGFYSDNGGFKMSDDDKKYMNTCKVVVSTCTFGGGDDLYQPIGMSNASLSKVCYVAFWDDITLATQIAAGKKITDDHMIGRWRIVVVRDLPFRDQRLNGKIPKMLSHRLFPQAKYSIWVDSKSQFRRDPLGVLEVLLWRTNSVFAISEHGARSSVYDEGKAVVKKHKATPEEVELQLAQYRHDHFPDDKRFNGKKALSEASVIVRENIPMTNLLMCLWFNEVVRFTSRDQLSFPYVLRRLNVKNINMFPVCTRKDLVNSMGHIRKAKPLIS